MKWMVIKAVVMGAILISERAHSQGFSNLGFENPKLPLRPVFNEVQASEAIRGWTAYYSTSTATNQSDTVGYNTVSIGGAAVILEDTNVNSLGPIALQGSYSVLLEGSSAGTPTAASIGQIGQVPPDARSLLFDLSRDSNVQVKFNGQSIPMVQIGATATYVIMGGNVSSLAGQTGQLLFTALPNIGYGLLDNIQFSSSVVPEPGTVGLLGLGAFLLRRNWRHRCRAIPKIGQSATPKRQISTK
jgi:hypothetical protein